MAASEGLPPPPLSNVNGIHGAYQSVSSNTPLPARSSSANNPQHSVATAGRSPIAASHPVNAGSLRRRQDQVSRDSTFQGGSLSSRHRASPFHTDPVPSASAASNHHHASTGPVHPRSYNFAPSHHLQPHLNSPPPFHQQQYSSSNNAAASSSRRPDLPSSSSSNTHPYASSSDQHPTSHSERSASSSNPNSNHVRSKHLLSHALELAQRAVDLDQAMQFPEALALYKETVLRLGEVMARVAATEKRRQERDGGAASGNQDEGRSLREIHDAYQARIALLETEIPASPTPTITQQPSTEEVDPGYNGVGSAILSLYQRTDSPSSSPGGPRTPRAAAVTVHPSHFDDTPPATSNLRRMESTSSNGSSRSHTRTMSLQSGPASHLEQPTPRPRAVSRPVFRSPLPPPAAPPPPPPPLPMSNRYSLNQGQVFNTAHSAHSSISSLTHGADLSASSGSQPATPSIYGGYVGSQHSPPIDVGSPLDPEYTAAQVRRQSLLESLRAGEEGAGIASFGTMPKSTSDRSLIGSFRQQGSHLEGVREGSERSSTVTSNGRRSPRRSEDSGMEVLTRTPLQPGFVADSRSEPAPPVPSGEDGDFSNRPSSSGRASVESTRSTESRGSRLGRSMKASVSPRVSIDDGRPPATAPRPGPSREAVVSPRTITGFSGSLLVSSADDKPFRISATDEGTISQRRRGPGLSETTFVPPFDSSSLQAQTLPIQRSSSAEPRSPSERTTEFGVGAGIGGGPATTGRGSQSQSSSMFSSTRLRALSQPGRRPSLSSTQSAMETSGPAPPVPSISRKASFPSQPPLSAQSSSAFALGRTVLDSTRTPHNRLNPPPSLTIHRSLSSSSSNATHSGMPASSASTYHPHHQGRSILLAASKLHTGIHSPQPPLAPQEILHRPFHLLRLLRLTMYDAGAYLTRKLFVGSEVWSQGGSKLLHLDTKIQVLQGLSFHLEAIESLGASLLSEPAEEEGADGQKTKTKGQTPSPAQVGVEFSKMLEDFEGVMDVSRTTLEKKVGSLGPMKPKARGAASLAAWGSKLKGSLDRFANGKNDGSLRAYVDAIEMICLTSQAIDLHLEYFTSVSPSPTSLYRQLPETNRNMIKTRLTTASQFFGQVVVTIILRDLMILLEKHGKMYGKFIEGP